MNKEMDEDNTKVDEKEEGCLPIHMRLRLLRFLRLLLSRNTPDVILVKFALYLLISALQTRGSRRRKKSQIQMR